MAKSQKKSNREVRKPKKQKDASKPDAAIAGSQVKQAGSNILPRGKAKV